MLEAKVIYIYENYVKLIIRHKTIILYFLTTTCRSYCLVKLQVWINHVDTWRRFDDDTTFMRLLIYFASTLKQLRLSKEMQLYKAINSIKIIFLGFWAMLQGSYTVEKVLKNIYFVFCILYNACQRLLLVDTKKKILIVSHSTSWVLQCTAA